MGAGIGKLDISEGDRELLRFTWRVVANADYSNQPGSREGSTNGTHASNDDDDASEHSFQGEQDDSPVNLGGLLQKKVFHVVFYDKFFKLSPASRQLFPDSRMKTGDILKVILNLGTSQDAATIKRLVSVHKNFKLSKQQVEAFAIAFSRTIEYKLDKLCTVYVARLWERVCMTTALSLHSELKRAGATSD